MAEKHNIEVVLDKNLVVETAIKKDNIVFLDPRKEPFSIHGLYDCKNESEYKRLPDSVATSANEGVAATYRHTSGGRIRFSTNSIYVAIKVEWDSVAKITAMPHTGSSGFDMYVDCDGYNTSKYYKVFTPPYYWECQKGYESVLDFKDRSTRLVTVNFPLYNNVKNIYIGLENGATVGKGKPYSISSPVVFYGSSKTQGGFVSRAGNTYPAILSRRLGFDFLNFGFEGGAKGDSAVIDYIASLDMSAFVCDYDRDASDEDFLATHKKTYQKIREKHPTIPYIIAASTEPDIFASDSKKAFRKDVCLDTYRYALEKGDKNVYFVDGDAIFKNGSFVDCYTVDGVNITDSAAVKLAQMYESVFFKIFGKGGM